MTTFYPLQTYPGLFGSGKFLVQTPSGNIRQLLGCYPKNNLIISDPDGPRHNSISVDGCLLLARGIKDITEQEKRAVADQLGYDNYRQFTRIYQMKAEQVVRGLQEYTDEDLQPKSAFDSFLTAHKHDLRVAFALASHGIYPLALVWPEERQTHHVELHSKQQIQKIVTKVYEL